MPEGGGPKSEEHVLHERAPAQRSQEQRWRKGCHGAEVAGHVGGAGIP